MKGKLKDFFELNPTQNTNRHKDFINYIDTASVENGLLTNIEFLSCNFPSRAQRIVKYDDILYSTVRPNLRHYYHYRKNYDHLVASTGFVLIRNKNAENYSTRFLFYYLSSNSVVKHLSNIAELSQSTFPSFSPKDLGKIDLPELTIEKQTKIASILSAYDELIENNNKRIKLLEQMAENLYKEWFVRFRFPGHETAEFENGIPKGWEIRRLDKVSKLSAGGDAPKDFSLVQSKEYPIPIYSNGIVNDGLYGYCKKPTRTAKSITISARGTVGFVCLRFQPYMPIVRLVSIEPKNESLDVFYLYYYFKENSIEGYGTSQQQITIPYLSKKKILIPSIKLIERFGIYTAKLFDKINVLKEKNQNLIKQRDLLLPRLMSGKLEVKNAK